MNKSILAIGTILAFTAGSTLFTSCGSNTHSEDESETTEQHDMDSDHQHDANETMAATHVCPMHPEITGLEGDTCSKCGMDLTLAEANEEEEEHQH
jgi:hypothetical protein